MGRFQFNFGDQQGVGSQGHVLNVIVKMGFEIERLQSRFAAHLQKSLFALFIQGCVAGHEAFHHVIESGHQEFDHATRKPAAHFKPIGRIDAHQKAIVFGGIGDLQLLDLHVKAH